MYDYCHLFDLIKQLNAMIIAFRVETPFVLVLWLLYNSPVLVSNDFEVTAESFLQGM
jgi:hypothetical protein